MPPGLSRTASVRRSAALAAALLLTIADCLPASAASRDLTITADSVNLYAGPSDRDDVVGQVRKGTVLSPREGKKGDWIEVAAPDHVSGWVYGELVNEGVVAVSRLRVRSGPGINYAPIARLDQGDHVTVRSTKGDWLEVAPPEQSSLWVHAGVVTEVGKSRKSKPEPATATATATRTVKQSTPAVAADAKAKKRVTAVGPRLAKWRAEREEESRRREAERKEQREAEHKKQREAVDVATLVEDTESNASMEVASDRLAPPGATVKLYEAGRNVVYRGTLRPAGMTVWRQPGHYRLVRYDRRSVARTICYLKGVDAELRPHLGQYLLVTGKEFRIRGVRYPLVVAEGMELGERR